MGLDTNPKDTLCAYDIESNTWKGLKGMPTARYATSAFLINEKLYVCGKTLILVVIFTAIGSVYYTNLNQQ
jgi:hypothetical protein